jgi:hypothetical protein
MRTCVVGLHGHASTRHSIARGGGNGDNEKAKPGQQKYDGYYNTASGIFGTIAHNIRFSLTFYFIE